MPVLAGRRRQGGAVCQGGRDTSRRCSSKFPKGKHVEEALFYQGESLYAQGKKAEAVAAYERLVKDFAKSKRRADALYALGVAQEELGKYAEAGKTYDVFLKEFADSPLATEVRMRKAETVLQAGDVAAAAKMFGEVAAVKDFAVGRPRALSAGVSAWPSSTSSPRPARCTPSVATDFPQVGLRRRCDDRRRPLLLPGRQARRRGQPGSQKAVDAQGCQLRRSGPLALPHSDQSGRKPPKPPSWRRKQLAAGGESPFAANLKLDQADALYEIPDKRAESLALYAKFAADHPQHELAPQALYNAAFTALELKQLRRRR